MKNKKIIVANWKMNPQWIPDAKKIASATARTSKKLKKTTVVVCPPFVFMSSVSGNIKSGKQCFLGAQDLYKEERGSFTGEISPLMLSNLGVKYAIIGHSERRKMGETDASVSEKAFSALKNGIIPIICVGEKSRDEHGHYLHELSAQIKQSLSGINKKFADKIIIAYEPIFAIGAKEPLSTREIHETTLYIRKNLSDLYGKSVGLSVPILYGGSVFSENAGEIVKEGKVDGLLVGRDSLDPKNFSIILETVDVI